MLATSRNGERARRWLQERIWGSRDRASALASLRRELSSLRALVGDFDPPVLVMEGDTVALNLAIVSVDVRDPQKILSSRDDFLEGIDLAWEEGFEEWLREERQAIQTLREGAANDASRATDVLQQRNTGGDARPRIAIMMCDPGHPLPQATIAENVVKSLAERFVAVRWLHLASTLTQPAMSDPAERDRLARQLTLDYAVICSLSRSGCLLFELYDARNNRTFWSGHSEGFDLDSLEQRSRCLEEVVAAISFQIEAEQSSRALSLPDDGQLEVEALLWRARWHKARLSHNDLAAADALLARAQRLAPNSSEIPIEQVECEMSRIWGARALPTSLEKIRDRLYQARDRDPCDARTWFLLGVVEIWRGRHDQALALLHEALQLNPSMSQVHAQIGVCRIFMGEPELAADCLHRAIELTPHDKKAFHRHAQLALAHIMMGEYEDAIDRANSSIAIRPDYAQAYVYGITASWMSGSVEAARALRDRLLAVDHGFDADYLLKMPFRQSQWPRMLHDVLDTALTETR